MPLCDHCTVLPAAWLVPRFYDLRDSKYPAHNEPMHWMHQPSWSALEVSAASCDLCALILREYVDDCEKLDPPNCQPEIRFQAFGGSRLEIRCLEQKKVAQLHVAFDDGGRILCSK